MEESYVDISFKGLEDKAIGAAFPNDYAIGIANLGHQRVIKEIADQGIYPHRFYRAPRALDGLRIDETGLLFVSISYELDYLTLVKMLEAYGSSARRGERDKPIVVVGGIFPTYNPAPFYNLADAVVIGDGEKLIGEILRVYLDSKTKEEFLRQLNRLPWIWVPKYSRLEVSNGYLVAYSGKRPRRRVYPKPTGRYYIVPPAEEVYYGERVFAIEVERGCSYLCRFCIFSHSNKPHRLRPIKEVKNLIERAVRVGVERIKLFYELLPKEYHEQLLQLAESYLDVVKFGFGGIRPELVNEKTARVLKRSQNAITLAPETSQATRYLIGKMVSDEVFLKALYRAASAGIENFGYYLMIGLPGETEESINQLAEFLARSWGIISKSPAGKMLEAHINPFFPKPQTPFQYAEQITPKEALERIHRLYHSLKETVPVELKTMQLTQGAADGEVAGEGIILRTIAATEHHYMQPLIARGGPEVLNYALESLKAPESYWKKLFHSEVGETAIRARDPYRPLPWEFVDFGFPEGYARRVYLNFLGR